MKIVFVYPAFGSLAIEYLSAVAKLKGHDVSMVFDPRLFDDSYITINSLGRLFSAKKKVAAQVVAEKPDLIAFSVVTCDFPWFREIGAVIRGQIDTPIVAGNIHITSVPEEALKVEFLDAVVRGEGEYAFADLLDSLCDGGIRPDIENLGVRENGEVRLNPLRPLIEDLDTLPIPDKTLYEKLPVSPTDIYGIMASRGCPFNCSYCNNNVMKRLYGLKGYVRKRSVDSVIDELKFGMSKYGSLRVSFFDELFGFDNKWMEEFTEKYCRDIALPYIACTNPHIVDEHYAKLLAESGCKRIDIGVQTVNQEKRRDIYHRKETNEQILRAFHLLKKHGITAGAENIINFPTENESDLLEMAHFYNEVRPDILKFFWLRYFPGTEIIDIALEHGTLTEDNVKEINSGDDIGSCTINTASSKLHKQFYVLFAFLLIMPKSWITTILKKRWYRFFPTFFLPNIAYSLVRIFNKKSPDAEMVMHQQVKRYKYYIKSCFSVRQRISRKSG